MVSGGRTEGGITSLQMDIKVTASTKNHAVALDQAKGAGCIS
jgi:polyribonucleotide nucleotidyltransferase